MSVHTAGQISNEKDYGRGQDPNTQVNWDKDERQVEQPSPGPFLQVSWWVLACADECQIGGNWSQDQMHRGKEGKEGHNDNENQAYPSF